MSCSRYEKRLAKVRKASAFDDYFVEEEFPDDNMSIERLQAFQWEALKEIIRTAYNKCGFYRKKMDDLGISPDDIKGMSDLSKMPFVTKEELRGHPWALLACDKQDIAVVTVSTGTTGGDEIYIPSTWRDYWLHEMAPGYPVLFPINPGDICINALPYEMSSAGLAFHKTFMDACLGTVVAAGKGGAYSTPKKTLKVMKDLKPSVLITTPSWAVSLAEADEENAGGLSDITLRKMWLTGEGCSFSFRNRVEKMWNTTANMYYGSLECGGVGIECDAHDGYHVLGAHSIVEIVDPDTGETLEPGEIGEIVVTCPLRFDTPLIRYRTKDIGYIDPSPCKCGVKLPRIFLRGRRVDQITVQGVSFSPYYLEEYLMRLPEVGNWYQFVVNKNGSDRLKIRAEVAKGQKPCPELAEKLSSRLEFGIGVPCDFILYEKLPRTGQKAVRVVSEGD